MAQYDLNVESTVTGVLPVDPGSANYYLEPEDLLGSSFFDAFGLNLPSYELQTVVITGERLTPWWTFSTTWLDLTEMTAIAGGGGGGGGGAATDPCGGHGQAVDWGFIEAREGNQTTGYVPSANGAPLGHSGVTVASGFDLGQHSAADLQALGLSGALTAQLSPYLGLQGAAAAAQLSAMPLSISAGDATAINSASHAQTLSNLVVQYDTATGRAGAFYSLAGEAQTVIASVAFQYGNLSTATPAFWSDVVHQDWSGAVGELRNFHDAYANRRGLEADLLQGAMTDNKLHDGEIC